MRRPVLVFIKMRWPVLVFVKMRRSLLVFIKMRRPLLVFVKMRLPTKTVINAGVCGRGLMLKAIGVEVMRLARPAGVFGTFRFGRRWQADSYFFIHAVFRFQPDTS